METSLCYNSTRKPRLAWYPTTGDIIEGLAILTSVTNNASTRGQLQDVIKSTVSFWQHQNQRLGGVLDLGPDYVWGYPTGDPFLVRGLSTAHRRNLTTEIRDEVKSFIDIQYNALLNNATIPGTDVYGGSWIGPPQRNIIPVNQTYAAMVLVQAINPDPSPTTTTTTTSSSSSTPSTKTGAIIGGIVGGVAFIAILTGLVLLLLCRRKRNRQGSSILAASSPSNPPSTSTVSPFVLQWDMDVSSKRDKSCIVSRADTQPAANEPEAQAATTWREYTNVQPEVAALGEAGGDGEGEGDDDLHVRFQTMSTAHMVRILNTRFESEAPPAYPQSQLGSSEPGVPWDDLQNPG
ncbi:hypothetical protein E1B28_002028 [Marasmius oreades]|uniref:Glycoside hydrolase family 76 protein n=1 Tax=Marasmius oreades TaxID=181124 RepID=A0A9P8AFT2_9AGAR|nr:uncharacterized protein E1B28_002028 [Marasmius oreades]KAG7100256.1 hypothetical protein E1B28_002028 [Marasmius oreades]